MSDAVQMCEACGGVMHAECGHRKNAIDFRQPIPCRPVQTASDEVAELRARVAALEGALTQLADWPDAAGRIARAALAAAPKPAQREGDER